MLNSLFHQPVRTYLMTFICINEEVSFLMLKDAFDLSFGNLSTHLSKLEKEGYIEVEKLIVDKKPMTHYSITPKGREEFYGYILQLEKLIEEVKKSY